MYRLSVKDDSGVWLFVIQAYFKFNTVTLFYVPSQTLPNITSNATNTTVQMEQFIRALNSHVIPSW